MQNKIKIVKQSHQVQSSAGNPHNSFLDSKEVAFLIQPQNFNADQKFPFSVIDNIIEWYMRTLADEIYKLAFIDDKKFYKIKMFWPLEYDQYEQSKRNDQNPNQMQIEQPAIKDPVTYYLSQFDGFEIEDYFDVIIMPKLNKQTKEFYFKFYLNSFTFLSESSNYSKEKALELFFEEDSQKFFIKQENDLTILSQLTKFLIDKYIFRQETGIKGDFTLDSKELWRRIIPILNEETRVLLYELYKDL